MENMPGRQFLQIPGPTNIPDRILRAMDRPIMDHRGPAFPALVAELLAGLKVVFGTADGEVLLFPGSGSGGWESAIVNTLNPGDRVLALVNGFFSQQFAVCARRFGVDVDEVEIPWGQPVRAKIVQDRLRAGGAPPHRAVLIAHNETATGVTSDIAAIRRTLDDMGHDALLLVDVVSSLASLEFSFDAWGVDVAVAGTQKGLMLPPGMAILCASPRAIARSDTVSMPRYFFDWRPMRAENRRGYFPYTPATLLLFGLREALQMLQEEGLPNVFARHQRLAEGVRAAVDAWGLGILCDDVAARSNSITAVVVPESVDASEVVRRAAAHLNLALGVGLGPLRSRVFRIGHLGALNELEVIATLAGTEMALRMTGAPVRLGAGLQACQTRFLDDLAAPAPPVASHSQPAARHKERGA